MELPVKAPVSGSRKTSYTIETKKLSYKLCSKFDELDWICCGEAPRGVPKFILRDVSCAARSGEITAIAGPSGAGKTTLLEILAGKISSCKVSGQVLVNSQPMKGRTFSTNIRELGLENVEDSRIGEGSNWGISGGERRRVSIGVELVHDPAVVFIDEPTSGLDSASALHVATLLKSMVMNQGKTIVLTIHQPGFRILELFDRLVLLSNGYVVHNGSLHFLEERLKFSGHQIPLHVNVLEFSIDALESLAMQNSVFISNECSHETRNRGDLTMRTPHHKNHQEKASPPSQFHTGGGFDTGTKVLPQHFQDQAAICYESDTGPGGWTHTWNNILECWEENRTGCSADSNRVFCLQSHLLAIFRDRRAAYLLARKKNTDEGDFKRSLQSFFLCSIKHTRLSSFPFNGRSSLLHPRLLACWTEEGN
ncbi:hypothetical protein OIU77_008989 [Salix suchowensis]|uniref:ABC transporter domain-containing protein n=1 Tax=Salix suchowensis TaxID=1278906 RepID=A0ABQ9ACT8_9ROSI|nr:hypothetical protein OIU77_008989 [Salix suchowensis]